MPVTAAMIRMEKKDTAKRRLNAGEKPEDLKIKELVEEMNKAKRQRLPVLDEKGAAVYIIHLSTLTEFVAQKSLGGTAPADIEKLTIGQLKADAKDLFDKILAWKPVPRGGTLADAKKAMEALRDCSDVFVTESGQANEPVLGWVTNADIALYSKA